MSTARRISVLPESDSNPAPSGEYRMVQPRAKALPATNRRRISGEYLDLKDGPIAMPMPIPNASARPKKQESGPVKSARPKVVALDCLDDAFGDEDTYPEENAPDAPDSLVQMMEGLEGAKVKEEAAWPKEMPAIPRPPSVPKMEAVRPPAPLQAPISRMTPASPRPMSEHQIIEEFAKFGPSPETLWQCVMYAFHVSTRKKELKQELGLFRERRASDVALYEKALRHVDEEAVRRGYLALAGGGVLGVLVIVMICVLL
jgi:hypothetical protein